jgi:exopolyphosphatase/guanosine-5'-triphosphate,3'-diphosphate pyrophosphatase
MRLGMLDVGSNTVHLLIVDAHLGARPVPAAKVRTDLPLFELFSDTDHLSEDGADRLVSAVAEARKTAEEMGVHDLAAFATSALRAAVNADDVLARIRAEADVDLQILDGEDEARLTFLAVRRWFGWGAGHLFVMDIGGGSLELAVGGDEDPAVAMSLPLGASRLTREWLRHDPPTSGELRSLREYLAEQLDRARPVLVRDGAPHLAVGTSKTLRSLARIAGAAPYRDGPFVRRPLSRADAEAIAEKVSGSKVKARARLPGVSPGRAPQLAAGAVVAAAVMATCELDEVVICPWALREGVILRRLDWLGVS